MKKVLKTIGLSLLTASLLLAEAPLALAVTTTDVATTAEKAQLPVIEVDRFYTVAEPYIHEFSVAEQPYLLKIFYDTTWRSELYTFTETAIDEVKIAEQPVAKELSYEIDNQTVQFQVTLPPTSEATPPTSSEETAASSSSETATTTETTSEEQSSTASDTEKSEEVTAGSEVSRPAEAAAPPMQTNSKSNDSADKPIIQEQDYFATNPQYIWLSQDVKVYAKNDLSGQPKQTLRKGTVLATAKLLRNPAGVPIFQVSGGYTAALKTIGTKITGNYKNYYTDNPGYIVMQKQDVTYKTADLNGGIVKKYAAGSVLKVTDVVLSKTGYPRFKVAGGYITANKSIVAKVTNNYQAYYLTAPKQVVMKKNDVVYNKTEFGQAQKGRKLSAGKVEKVSGIAFSSSGYPRFKVAGGYLTANKSYVQTVTNNYNSYYLTNPKQVVLKKNDVFYRDTAFTKKGAAIKTGTVVKVQGIVYTSGGTPRLKTSKGYLTANKKYVNKVIANYQDYYTSKPARIKMKVTDWYYNGVEFNKNGRKSKLPKNTVVSVENLTFTSSGIPRLKVRGGYLTANKKYVVSTSASPTIQMNVPFYSQYAVGAPQGCETASLWETFRYKGYASNQSLPKLLKALPLSSNNNPYNGFAGTPFKTLPASANVHQTIFPKAFVPFANKYAPGKIADISGSSVTQLRNELLQGNPVIIWATYLYQKPVTKKFWWGTGVTNLHVMVVDGYKDGRYHLTDPISGKFWVSEAQLYRAYKPKKMAVAVR